MEANARKAQENHLRQMARQLGLTLTKSRRRDPEAPDYGTYQLIPQAGLPGTPWSDRLPDLAAVKEWLTDTPPGCAHCGATARGYARDARGNRLCHVSDQEGGPDCYRRVTVWHEPLGTLAAARVYPDGVQDIRRFSSCQ